MSNQTTKAFKEALDKFIHIGNCYYNSKHHDNVLNIFNDMEHIDRIALLKGVFHIYSIFEFGIEEHSSMPVKTTPKPETEVLATSVDENINNKALVELKFWTFKVTFILGLMFFFGFIILVFFMSDSVDTGHSTLNKFFGILSLLFSES